MSLQHYELRLRPGQLSLQELQLCYRQPVKLIVDDSNWGLVEKSRGVVEEAISTGQIIYGINTGFGRLAQKNIDEDDLEILQENLILSHATGVGEYLPREVVRLCLILKINALMQGCSGIRRSVVKKLMVMLEHELLPCVPAKGSVGASGDLAPLAHLVLPLIGYGQFMGQEGCVPVQQGWDSIGEAPIRLGAKEGLALLNGTQVSTALALTGLFESMQHVNAAFVAGSLTVEAALASRVPFDARIHDARGQPGQIEAARLYRSLLETSEIAESHAECDKVQDPYSIRCQPQVMGAVLDQLAHSARILAIESNAVSDNPLVFPDNGDVLSGGNFHAEPVAFAADNMALAIAECGALSERRMALLLDTAHSSLPAFLVEDAGVNSGFMIAQVTAAALASENKSLAHPASVDSLPTSANQEDHVSMATFAARRLGAMNLNTRYIVSIELLAAAQGIELRRPLKSNQRLEDYWEAIRSVAAYWDHDRYFQPDLEAISELIQRDTFLGHIDSYVLTSALQKISS